MKTILILISIISGSLFSLNCTAQAPLIQWRSCYGGTQRDNGFAAVATHDGYVMVGRSNSPNGDITHPASPFTTDMWIVKVSLTGAILWQTSIGGSGQEIAYDIKETTDGGFIVCGETTSGDGDVTGYHGVGDGWVVKLDNIGNIVWQKALGGSAQELLNAIIQTSDGGYLVAGGTASADGDVIGYHPGIGPDVWVVKLSSAGDILWQHCYGGAGDEVAFAITATSDNNYLLTGYTGSEDGDVTGHHGGLYVGDAWTLKISNTGTLLWQKCLGGAGYEAGYSIIEAVDGKYTLASTTTSSDGDVTGYRGGTAYEGDFWIVELDNMGNVNWKKTYGGTGPDVVRSMVATPDGGFVIAGWTASEDGQITSKNGGTDIWLIKIDNVGNLLWQRCMGGAGGDYAHAVLQSAADEYFVLGYTGSSDGDIDNFKGWEDFWAVKLGTTEGVDGLISAGTPVSVFPNPSNGTFSLVGKLDPSEKEYKLEVINVLGQIVHTNKYKMIGGKIQEDINLSGLQCGIYSLRLTAERASVILSLWVQ